jgi:hypothetical protein
VICNKQTAPAEIYLSEHAPCTTEVENVSSQVINSHVETASPEISTLEKGNQFLKSKKITTTVVKSRPKKKFIPPKKIIGNLHSEKNQEILKENHDKSGIKENNQANSLKSEKTKVNANVSQIKTNPKPSTSGLNSNKGGPINLDESTESEDSSLEDDSEPCCQCKNSFPPHLKGYPGLVILKWAQCDTCGHWVHLTHCCEISSIRRGVSFFCKCCE